MIETQTSIQFVHDTSPSFLFQTSESKMKTEVSFDESKQTSVTPSDTSTYMKKTKPNPKCQCFKSLPRSATVQWGNAYVYLSNVDPKETSKTWYNVSNIEIRF
jgi:hypothetical protein